MNTKHYKLIILFLAAVIILFPLGDHYLNKPKNSIELYQSLAFSKDFEEAKDLMLDDKQSNFSIEDFNTIQEKPALYGIHQYTLLEYGNKTMLIKTTPGTKKLEIIRVVELPEEISRYLLDLPE